MKTQKRNGSEVRTIEDRAAEEMITADGIHLMEEFAMSHLWDFAERLEKTYEGRLKKSGLGHVDYFEIAERFTRSLFTRLQEQRSK